MKILLFYLCTGLFVSCGGDNQELKNKNPKSFGEDQKSNSAANKNPNTKSAERSKYRQKVHQILCHLKQAIVIERTTYIQKV